MTNKNGVTMIILVVTIIIAILLLSVSVAAIGNSIKNANLVSFRQELTNINQEVEKYYSLTGNLPGINDTTYSIDTVATLSENRAKFLEEVTTNRENSDSYFVKIDLSKLQFDKSVRGLLKDGANGKDVFIVSYPSLNVYYLAGFKEGNDIYFSLANLEGNSKIEVQDETVDIIRFSGDLRVKKLTNNWTNELNIQILTFMESNETLAITIPTGASTVASVTLPTESSKTNDISLKTLSSVGFSSQDINSFNALAQENKKANIVKTRAGVVTGNVEVELFNYDGVAPTYNGNLTQSSYTEYNTYSFQIGDSLSGAKGIKYEYYMKVEDADPSVYLESVDMYTKDYLIKNGKEVEQVNNIVTIKLPKNIVSIKYVIEDKAGNATDVLELNTKYPILIRYSTVSGTDTSITFNANVDTSYSLTSFKSSISTDGVNYTSEYTHTNPVSSFTYTDITNMNDYLYVKLVAVAGGITETRIIKVDAGNFTKEGTRNKSEASSYNPYIPEGFVHTIGNVRTGFVIQDVSNTNNKYNEFVWIPVEYVKTSINAGGVVTNSKTLNTVLSFVTDWNVTSSLTKSTAKTTALSSSYTEFYSTDSAEYNNILTSIQRYGGFYIARYEAGSTVQRTSSSGNTEVVVRKNVYPYNYVKISNAINNSSGGAIELCRNMYTSSTDIKSNLVYGFEWDAIMYFISIFNKNVSSSAAFGNYNSSSILLTGSSDSYSTANIYDLAGNLEEWTMEVYNSNTRVARGGNSSVKAAAQRNYSFSTNTAYQNVGFRPALYIVN